MVDAKSESIFTFVDELSWFFFVAGGSSTTITTTRLSSLRVHFSVDGDVDKSFSDLIFVFVGEDMGEVFVVW